MKAIWRIAVIAAALAIGVPLARADSTDSSFLREVGNYGITAVNGPQALIVMAHEMCTIWSTWPIETAGSIAHAFMTMANGRPIIDMHGPHGQLTQDDLTFFARASATAYCPQYLK